MQGDDCRPRSNEAIGSGLPRVLRHKFPLELLPLCDFESFGREREFVADVVRN